jgi:Mn-dependent DtxR family transcriptional regulator
MVPTTINRLNKIYSKIKDKKTITEEELLFCISKQVGFYPPTVNQYFRFLKIYGYIEHNEDGTWTIKKVETEGS